MTNFQRSKKYVETDIYCCEAAVHVHLEPEETRNVLFLSDGREELLSCSWASLLYFSFHDAPNVFSWLKIWTEVQQLHFPAMKLLPWLRCGLTSSRWKTKGLTCVLSFQHLYFLWSPLHKGQRWIHVTSSRYEDFNLLELMSQWKSCTEAGLIQFQFGLFV